MSRLVRNIVGILSISIIAGCTTAPDISESEGAKSAHPLLVTDKPAKKAKDYIYFRTSGGRAGYHEQNWIAENRHPSSSIRIKVRLKTGGSIPRYIYPRSKTLKPGESKHVGYRIDPTGQWYSRKLMSAEYVPTRASY